MKNEIYFRRKSKILIEKGSAEKPKTNYLVTMIKNIQSLGFCFSSDLLVSMNTYSVSELEGFYLEVVPILKNSIGAHVQYNPMYPNFPKQVMELCDAELYWNALLHYATSGYIIPFTQKEERLPYWDKSKTGVLELGTEKEFYSLFTNLMQSKTSISDTDKEDLAWFFKNNTNFWSYLPDDIPLKENVAYISKLIIENAPILSSRYISKYFKTATDVLRLVTALSGGDISLSKNTKFRSFKRIERRFILDLLENCNMIETDMKRYKEKWLRVGERLHPAEYKGYEKTKKAFDKIRNGKYIYSFGGSVTKAMEQSDFKKAVSLLSQRPGEFARKLDYVLRNTEIVGESVYVLAAFENVAEEVDSPVLLQVKEHFRNRVNNKSSIRVFFPKGNMAKAQSIDNNLDSLPQEICDYVVAICEKALLSTYSKREPLGKVYIGKELKNYLVPFSQRSASKAFKTIVRGSRIPLGNYTNVIRTFLWWKNGNKRTDLDLSAIMFDEDWKYKEHISFTNLKSMRYDSCHSGDIVNAPNGASEFIDINVDSIEKYGGRYLAFLVLSYTGQEFSELPECFMGFMEREKVNSGEIYEPKSVQNKIDITSESQTSMPIVFDVVTRQYIWTDLTVKRNINWYNTVESNQASIISACRSMIEIRKPNLYDLIELNAKSRGDICESKEEADLIFDINEGITPYDLDVISANYL